MDVPFSLSGAVNRAYYVLVHKVETAKSPDAAEDAIQHEIDAIRGVLSRPTLSLEHLKENLILLMYCATSTSFAVATSVDFAYHHAISLAEAGRTVPDKRTGYTFCVELMPPGHELQLMLVNTLRKDLESEFVSNICLALETLTQLSSEDALPAIRPRLVDLLSHHSAAVRQKSLAACLMLAEYNPTLLTEISSKAVKRTTDADASVACAAFAICQELLKAGLITEHKFHRLLSDRMRAILTSRPNPQDVSVLLSLLRSLCHVAPSANDLLMISDILHAYGNKTRQSTAVLYQCFLVLANSSVDALRSAQETSAIPFVEHIRCLLTSQDLVDVYTFVACLECLDPALWAGSQQDLPSVLEAWEVERIMQLLDCLDKGIRTKTLHVVNRVDPGLVEAQFSRLSHGLGHEQPHQTGEHVKRLLEVVRVLSGDEGESYVQHVKDLLCKAEDQAAVTNSPVLEGVTEEILLDVRNGSEGFRLACIGALFASFSQPNLVIGSTLMVVLVALMSEFLQLSPISPMDLLRGLADRLTLYAASVQEACLLCMMRIACECDEPPPEVKNAVQALHEQAGRHIRRRCEQFIELAGTQERSRAIIAMAKSFTLPEFLLALETYEAEKEMHRLQVSSSLSAQTSPQLSRSHKLRYDAYDPPRPVSRLRHLSNGSSGYSDDRTSKFIDQGRSPRTSASNVLSPGDLTVMATRSDLSAANSPTGPRRALPLVRMLDNDNSTTQRDLIALESPSVSEPLLSISGSLSAAEPDFGELWELYRGINSRGWSEKPIDNMLRRLQDLHWSLTVTPADVSPFEGDVKIHLSSDETTSDVGKVALLRLKESDDGSCLWQLRCTDELMQRSLRNVLESS